MFAFLKHYNYFAHEGHHFNQDTSSVKAFSSSDYVRLSLVSYSTNRLAILSDTLRHPIKTAPSHNSYCLFHIVSER